MTKSKTLIIILMLLVGLVLAFVLSAYFLDLKKKREKEAERAKAVHVIKEKITLLEAKIKESDQEIAHWDKLAKLWAKYGQEPRWNIGRIENKKAYDLVHIEHAKLQQGSSFQSLVQAAKENRNRQETQLKELEEQMSNL